MIKLYIGPDYYNVPPHADNGGIRRVVEAQVQHLPKFGVEVIHNPDHADVIMNHGGMLVERSGIPNIHVGHGLYWSRQPWGDNFQEVNELVVESMRHSVAWTAPSEWVSRAIRRGGYWYPEVVYHGVDANQFHPAETNGGYVLWNKARADYVSNPDDMMTLARRLQNRMFKTTIGHPETNVSILGNVSHNEMQTLVANAGVYLSTVRETFGIGVLEALACGIPVAGFDWGGNSEIIVQGETGWLAPPGDFKALAECVERCFADRARISRNAVEDVRARWGWEPRIKQYANIIHRVHHEYNVVERPKVSVLVTAYKLDAYLPKCLDSIHAQTMQDFECLVIDDAQLESTKTLVRSYAARDNRIRYCPTPENMGLPGARNYGHSISNGRYVRHVDADDFLAENTLALEVAALDQFRGLDVVYGHLEVVNEDGSQITDRSGEVARGTWPAEKFSWYQQMSHLNQLPSCAMARREVYERSGGYRTRMKRNEDAEFWCRVSSLGFRIQKFTQAVTYYHRERADSKGATEWKTEGGEPDWTAWFPWRMGAADSHTARDILRNRGEAPRNAHLVPFGAQGKPPRGLRFWYVHDHSYPVVSIIVTCGPGHKRYLLDALDSIQAQNYPDWECVVVNDTGEAWPADIMGAPWAKVVNMDGNRGASAARNEGIKYIRGKYVIWMDADDIWLPWFLERMVGYAEYNDGVIFSDIIMQKETNTIYRYEEFNPQRVPLAMRYPGSSVLVPVKIARAVFEKQGGWDLNIPGMEDWDFQVAIHDLGFCAYHIPEPLFVYRMLTSTKRENDYDKIELIRAYMDAKWGPYRRGEKQIMCSCQTKKTPPSNTPSSTLTDSGNFSQESLQAAMSSGDKSQMVVVEYIGPVAEPFTINSRIDRNIRYRFSNGENHRSRAVLVGDAEFLLGLRLGEAPTYRVVGTGQPMVNNDPSAFLGQAIAA